MDKIIQMEKHHIEAWGLWWVQWQKQTKEELRKTLVSPKSKDLLGNTTTSLVLPPK
jgi:hypothetical protein